MRIQHNISALNSWGKLGINQSNSAKNLEKLSSGYRINRAGDDAAGLAISEKMRGQIRGLDMASKNAQDGISLIQTAEGALDETHSILQRMRELAVQSANGTYQDEDRANTDLEVQALKSELDRIASSTHFNKIQLLDGSLAASGGTKGTAGKAAAKVGISDAALSAGAMKINAAVKGEYSTQKALTAIQDGNTNEYSFNYTDENGQAVSTTVTLKYNDSDGKIYGADGTVLKDTGKTGVKSAGASDVAEALKTALEKSDVGNLFTIELGTGFDHKLAVAMATVAAGKTLSTTFSNITVPSTGVTVIEKDGTTYHYAAGNTIKEISKGATVQGAALTMAAVAAVDGNDVVKDGLKFTAKTAGAKAAVFNSLTQVTGPGSSRIYGSGKAGENEFTLDFSSVDTSKIKNGDKLSIGTMTFEFTNENGVTSGSNTFGKINLSEIEGGANLADAIAKSYNKAKDDTAAGNVKGGTLLVGGGTAAGTNQAGVTFSVTASGNNLKLTFAAGGSLAASDLTTTGADQQGLMTQIKYTPKNGITETGGGLGIGTAIGDFGRVEDKAALDRYETYDMSKVGVWEGTDKATDNIEDKIFTVDGKQFLFVKDNTEGQSISVTNQDKAVAKYGNDINIVRVTSSTLTANDVTNMANRIMEKTSTNVRTNGLELSFLGTPGTTGSAAGSGKLTFQIGANGSADQRVSMSIDDMSSKGIGVDKVDITTADSANKAIDIVDKAINTVSATRANLGAMQNRLEHTINSLNTTSENLTAAESRIRDVDMAKEMMAFTKNNILTQAAQAMLAQANQQPQGVLQLLQ